MGVRGSSLKPNVGGKYAGGIGIKENFRRPLRPDARAAIPEKMKRYTRHDWYWGMARMPFVVGFTYWTVTSYMDARRARNWRQNPSDIKKSENLLDVAGDVELIRRAHVLAEEIQKGKRYTVKCYIQYTVLFMLLKPKSEPTFLEIQSGKRHSIVII